jgi:hypothetical protein
MMVGNLKMSVILWLRKLDRFVNIKMIPYGLQVTMQTNCDGNPYIHETVFGFLKIFLP